MSVLEHFTVKVINSFGRVQNKILFQSFQFQFCFYLMKVFHKKIVKLNKGFIKRSMSQTTLLLISFHYQTQKSLNGSS